MTESWSAFHKASNLSQWSGRQDNDKLERLFQTVKIFPEQSFLSKKPSIAFIGFKSDEGVIRNHGREGAFHGSSQLRQKLGPLALNQELTFDLFDAGDIVCDKGNLEEAQSALGEYIQYLRSLSHPSSVSFVLGGGHETAWGHFQGLTELSPDEHIAIINFDAHFDLRPMLPGGLGTSGTPFAQIADYCHKHNREFDYTCIGIQPAANTQSLFEKADLLNTHYILAEEIHQQGIAGAIHQIEAAIKRADKIYLSICLDVLSLEHAPGVSAPQALGLAVWDLIPLLRRVVASKKVCALDIVELAPNLDTNEQTSLLAANLAFDCLKHLKR